MADAKDRLKQSVNSASKSFNEQAAEPEATNVVAEETAVVEETSTGSAFDALAEAAQKAEEEEKTTGGVLDKSNVFGEGGATIDTSLTPEEKTKAEKSLEAQRKIMKKNEEVNEWKTGLLAEASSVAEFSRNQQMFQLAGQEHIRAIAFLVERDGFCSLDIKRTYLTQTTAGSEPTPILLPGKTMEDYNNVKSLDKAKKVRKGSVQKSKTEVVIKTSSCSKPFGVVLQMPVSMAISLDNFTRSDFTFEEQDLNVENTILCCASYDTAFAYISLFCDGTVKESDGMQKASNLRKEMVPQLLKTAYERRTHTDRTKNTTTTRTVKVIKAIGRTTLCVRENIVPMKRFEQKPLSSMSSVEVKTYERFFVNRFKKAEGEPTSLYDLLSKDFVSLFNVKSTDKEGNPSEIECLFFKTPMFGVGNYKDIVSRDWSGLSGKSKNQQALAGNPIVVLEQRATKDDKMTKPAKIVKIFGEDFTLDKLKSEGYVGAGILSDAGLEASKILTVYAEHLSKVKEASLAKGTQSRTVRPEAGSITSSNASRILMQEMAGAGSTLSGTAREIAKIAISSKTAK